MLLDIETQSRYFMTSHTKIVTFHYCWARFGKTKKRTLISSYPSVCPLVTGPKLPDRLPSHTTFCDYATGWATGVRFPAGAGNFFSSPLHPHRFSGLSSLLAN